MTKEKQNQSSDIVFSDHELLRYMELREAEKYPMYTREQMAYYMVWLLWQETAGSAYIVLLDEKYRFLKSRKIKDARLWQAQLFTTLEDDRKQLGAVYYFVGHNHVGNPLIPSLEDREITMAMIRSEGLVFRGHFITDSAFSWVEIE